MPPAAARQTSPSSTTTTAAALLKELRAIGSAEVAEHSQRFFKTGKGEYGEGEEFLGVRVPKLRALAKTHQSSISLAQVLKLLQSRFHEARLLAVILLTLQYARGDEKTQKKIYESYLKHTKYINSWDIVDASAHKIVGPRLHEQPAAVRTVRKLVRSKSLWERRIAVLATFKEIEQSRFELAIEFATALLHDKEDLIHKAVGWMLRDAGKKDKRVLLSFLDQHATAMPRTMLRYAIEKLPEKQRRQYMATR